mmetsp:Transcript_9091/g.26095  ORF Transcript_9091/g.26095 Transcript_9091/m.26095 type:complete len:226 (-) Transcript_9091:269-946(-)
MTRRPTAEVRELLLGVLVDSAQRARDDLKLQVDRRQISRVQAAHTGNLFCQVRNMHPQLRSHIRRQRFRGVGLAPALRDVDEVVHAVHLLVHCLAVDLLRLRQLPEGRRPRDELGDGEPEVAARLAFALRAFHRRLRQGHGRGRRCQKGLAERKGGAVLRRRRLLSCSACFWINIDILKFVQAKTLHAIHDPEGGAEADDACREIPPVDGLGQGCAVAWNHQPAP